MTPWIRRTAALISVAACAVAGALPAFVRPSMRGAIVERRLDTNGDGRPDVVEYYRDGALLRRDSDRNFNGVTDLVEDFDAVTQARVRSIVDQDDDGTADLLLLYRNGDAVVSERASGSPAPGASVRAGSSGPLVALRNPFSGRRAFDAFGGPLNAEVWMGPTAAPGVLASAAGVPIPVVATRSLLHAPRAELAADGSLRSPRGPPLA